MPSARWTRDRTHCRNRLRVELLEDRVVPSVLYDESISGDLSNDQMAPTPLSTAVGANSVLGTVGGGAVRIGSPSTSRPAPGSTPSC